MSRFKASLNLKRDSDVARLFQISTAGLSERKKKQSIPYEHIVNACRDANISLDYIFKGISNTLHGKVVENMEQLAFNNPESYIIPYYKDVRCMDNNYLCDMTLSFIVLPKLGHPELDNTSLDLKALSACGDSMEPSIKKGAIMLIDFKDTIMEDNKIYVINYNGETMLKRLFINPVDRNKYILKSDNKNYSDFIAEKNDVIIAGRVIYAYNKSKLS